VREQGWRSAKGLQRLAQKYGAERIEGACAHALHFGARSHKPVERLRELGREQLELPGSRATTGPIAHENTTTNG
jgi:hypothetical protein